MDAVRGRPGRGCEPDIDRLYSAADSRLRDLARYWIDEIANPSDWHPQPPVVRAVKGMAAAFTSYQMGVEDSLSVASVHRPRWDALLTYWEQRMFAIANGPSGDFWIEQFIHRVVRDGMPTASAAPLWGAWGEGL